jgi:hypothetical protein
MTIRILEALGVPTVLLALLVLAAPTDAFARGEPTAAEPCEGPGALPWAIDFRDRMLAYDGLTGFAVEEYGAPVACEGTITDEFDGAVFGTLLLTFSGGVTVESETFPPESNVTMLRSATGFADEAALREVVRAYAAGIGLRIDWSTDPEVTLEGDERVERYWDPDPGLNASASLVFRGGALVAVGVGMAL